MLRLTYTLYVDYQSVTVLGVYLKNVDTTLKVTMQMFVVTKQTQFADPWLKQRHIHIYICAYSFRSINMNER